MKPTHPRGTFGESLTIHPSNSFGAAIEALKWGMRVARRGWNGKGMYLYLLRWEGSPYELEPCIVMHTAQGLEQPGWLASQADMLAEDWYSVPT